MPSATVLPALTILAGIVSGVSWPAVSGGWLASALVICWIGSVAAFCHGRTPGVMIALVAGFFVVGVSFGGVAAARAVRTPLRAIFDSRLDPQPSEPVYLEGRLRDDAVPTEYGASLILAVDRIHIAGVDYQTSGGVRLTVGGGLVAQRLDGWRSGRRIRVPASLRRAARYLNPGVADQEITLARRGIALIGSVKSAAVVEVISRGDLLDETAARIRAAVRRAIAEHVGVWNPRSASIVAAILIGDRAGLDESVSLRLQEAGTYHVIAISGGNIAILAGLVLGLLRWSGTRPRSSAIIAIAVLIAYAAIVGGGPSVVRATTMAVVCLGAAVADHRTAAVNALALTGLLVLSLEPLAIFDPGFTLSFGATVGILAGADRVARAIAGLFGIDLRSWPVRPWLSGPLLLLAATICAEVALLPIAAFVFSRVTFAGLALNFAAIPLMTAVQCAGLALVASSPILPPLAGALGYLAHRAADGLVSSAALVDLVPWLAMRVPAPAVAVVLIYYGAIALCLAAPRPPVIRRSGLIIWLAATIWILQAPTLSGLPPSRLRVTFLDVGQGDAGLVQLPGGVSLLIDAGGAAGGRFDPGERIIAPALWARGVRRLDYLAITHGDPDHMGGAATVVRDFRPHEIWEGIPVPTHQPIRGLRMGAARHGTSWRTVQAGASLSAGAVEIRVWHPPPPDWERPKVRNDDSLVIEVRLGRVAILFPGDIGRDVETTLANHLPFDGIRIVKVPHHGSRSSSSEPFVQEARPAAVIVSAGYANRYGHPAAEVLQRYRDVGASILRTDIDGAITVETDGRIVTVETMTGRRMVFALSQIPDPLIPDP